MLERFLKQVEFSSWDDFCGKFSIRAPEGFNFAFDVVDELAVKCPNGRALVWCNDHGERAEFTFAQMSAESAKMAHALKSLGIRKGDFVMLVLKRRYEFWFCLLALHRIGAVAVPATHLLTSKDIAYRCQAADIKAVITVPDERILDQVRLAEPQSPTLKIKALAHGQAEGWISLDALAADYEPVFPRGEGDENAGGPDPLLTYFTSGTTGMPKMVMHDHTYPLGHILTARYWQNARKGGLHLTVADTGWAKTAWGKIYGQWLCESAVMAYDMDRFEPHRLLEVVSRERVTTFCAPPTVFRYLIKEDLSQYDLSAVEYCVVAGEPLNPEVYQAWLRGTGLRLMEGFGQTETVVSIANYPWFEPRPGSTGRPSPGWNVDLLNDDGAPCDPGEPGEIVIYTGGEPPVGLFRGYYRDEELTASVWSHGVYHTGDLAWRDEDGYYWFLGRADDIIKTSGYRVGPFEVESVLLEHPAVTECAVTGVPDDMRGQAIKATCVLSKGYEPSDELVRELQDHVKTATAPYKYPRIVEFVQELPKTISGKVKRNTIRDQDTC